MAGIIRQLIARGALQTGEGQYASLVLVPEHARPILRAETRVMLREESDAAPPVAARRERAAAVEPNLAADDPLLAALKAWRTVQSKVQSVPPYVIFHDSVLREIAAARPESRAVLATVRGVGGSKLERYGDAILALVRERS